ncbi:hypothetical protein ACQKMD_00740 [Viridibacillus sp. NPDC096237]|uniref:hypothetical protein n=1 Tax=Viridibacillus sp. NPDC096237 TaxID=3390721 RepID=UPI003D06B9B2
MNRKTVGAIILIIGILIMSGKFFLRNFGYHEVLSWGGLALTILGAVLLSEKKT